MKFIFVETNCVDSMIEVTLVAHKYNCSNFLLRSSWTGKYLKLHSSVLQLKSLAS